MATILFHDGCNICLSIAAAFESLDTTIDIVNLGVDSRRAAEAVSLGVTRLPSLVVNAKVLKIEDHSSIEHVLA
ncbi:hypothetical protein [Jeongeupia naejangsanensis]|uniref:Thioredoxin family protein n=1 Tax=Jeongeupia naejangsanensis TaxID=613195 RepID=A0ABS2BN06_9NEIS|nr:hypothetical protein [Jeongeupia naejangsanensis]MBM3116815.1 hypothetical protein [Jeongeupia naejangsanensis]